MGSAQHRPGGLGKKSCPQGGTPRPSCDHSGRLPLVLAALQKREGRHRGPGSGGGTEDDPRPLPVPLPGSPFRKKNCFPKPCQALAHWQSRAPGRSEVCRACWGTEAVSAPGRDRQGDPNPPGRELHQGRVTSLSEMGPQQTCLKNEGPHISFFTSLHPLPGCKPRGGREAGSSSTSLCPGRPGRAPPPRGPPPL